MKIALVTTTINVPHVLEMYAAEASCADAQIFVAGDLKTPDEAKSFCGGIGARYLTMNEQYRWSSSEKIGWNTDSRRNFAILEALSWGAELIVTVDDDMIPQPGFFEDFERLFAEPWTGIQMGVPGAWFDHGLFTVPPAPARGLPPEMDDSTLEPTLVSNVTIGIAQGTIIGVPDTDAVTALGQQPFIFGASDVLRQGFVTHPLSHCVFNSQFTAFRRELAPFAGQFYQHQGRNTDIFAAVAMRKRAYKLNWFTHYGPPLGFHARRKRSLFRDLEAEMFGLREIENALSEDFIGVPPDVYGAWLDDCRVAMNGE